MPDDSFIHRIVSPLVRFFALFLVLLASWLLWSGVYQSMTIGLGIFSCVFVVWLTSRMRGGDFAETRWSFWLRFLLYIPWIMWEIAKANLDVTLCVLGIRPISPRIIRVPASQKTDLGQTLYANSITLTPGTISLDVRENSILVHALTADTAAGLADGAMDAKASWVEGRT
jgi:multicomponent Na+:H+ antiporter subunit E